MATTENFFIADGYETLFAFTFEYISPDDVKVQLDGVDTTEYTLANPTTVELNVAPPPDVVVRVYRLTDTSKSPTTFYSGSTITAKGLNDNFSQTLFVSQEVQRDQQEAISSDRLSQRALANSQSALSRSNQVDANVLQLLETVSELTDRVKALEGGGYA